MTEFGARSTALEVIAGHDLHGKTALVTGGASGIGTETVRALATAGAHVVVAVRDPGRAEAAIERVRLDTGSDLIEVVPLDLASLKSVHSLTEGYDTPLHLLFANAGVMATPRSATADGFELQFGTNHLGHFALVTGLLPALRAGAEAIEGGSRVVVVSSAAHRRSAVDFDDLDFEVRPYDPWTAYGQSKTANILFAVDFTGRYATDGITANALHPGGILTNLQRHVSHEEQVNLGFFEADGSPNKRFKTPEQGASTSVWAAVAPELTGVGGLYLEDCRIGEENDGDVGGGYKSYARDPEQARRLWEVSDLLLASA